MISSLDNLITALAQNAQKKPYFKVHTIQSAGSFTSLFTTAGQPGAASNPSSGVAGDVPTKATAGAIPFDNPTSDYLYLARMAGSATVAGTLYLYDRLWHNSGLSVTSTSSQGVNSVALTRPDNLGIDVEAWWQTYATMGSGTPTLTLTYTNQDGVGSRSGTAIIPLTAMTAGRTGQFQLQAGDTGVRSIQSYQASATMTSGTFGLVLRRRITSIACAFADVAEAADAFRLGLPEIPTNACLEILYFSSSTGSTSIYSDLTFAQG
jgi:hypothetical protein